MDDSQLTRMTLIARLRDHRNGEAWTEFVEIYTPVVYRHLRRAGLQDADAADVTQDVFRTVARSIDGFRCDRAKGSFRGWLMTVARSRLCDHLATRKKHVQGTGDSAIHEHLDQLVGQSGNEEAWEHDYQHSIFEWAARQIRVDFTNSTWDAFWQTCVQGRDTKTVAAELGITVAAVYIAKCRVTVRLKDLICQLDE